MTAGTISAETSHTLYWEGLGWEYTLWRYLTTNHHYLSAIASRVTNSLWQNASATYEWEFSELALRLPSLLAGLGGIFLWSALLRPASKAAACLVALILALHPWYIQFLTEVRGYAFLFALVPFTLLCLRLALSENRRRWWIGVIAAQTLAVYAWPGVLPSFAGLQIVILLALLLRRSETRAIRRRWLLANVGTAMILLQLTAPGLTHVWEYLGEEVPSRSVGGAWLLDEASWFLLGCDAIDYSAYFRTNPLFVTAQSLLQRNPALTIAALLLLLFSSIHGLRIWWRRVPLGREILSGFGSAALAIWLLAAATGTALYSWYFVHLLPVFAACTALGLAELCALVGRRIAGGRPGGAANGAGILAGAVALAIIGATYSTKLSAMTSRSKDPRRESVALARPEMAIDDLLNTRIITAHCNQPAIGYDPHGWLIKTGNAAAEEPPGLSQLMRLADTTDATLWVIVGGLDSLALEFPEVAGMLVQPELFEPQHHLHGLEPQFQRKLYRYRGGVFDFLKGL